MPVKSFITSMPVETKTMRAEIDTEKRPADFLSTEQRARAFVSESGWQQVVNGAVREEREQHNRSASPQIIKIKI